MEKVGYEICETGKVLGYTKKPPLQREQVEGEFTSDTKEFCKKNNIDMINGNELLNMCKMIQDENSIFDRREVLKV